MNQMTTCYDAMCDIETMGTDNDAAIVSVAVTMFDVASETIGASFVKNIHLASAMYHGGTTSAGTIMFWLRQGDAVRNPIWQGGEDIRDVFRDLAIWLGNQCGRNEQGIPKVRMWGNSARFDLGIVESAYKRAQIPVPWYWSNERCFRTVRNLNPQVVYDIAEKGSGAHDPLVDCKFQIEHLFKIKRARRGQA
jgi:hypothetical protein